MEEEYNKLQKFSEKELLEYIDSKLPNWVEHIANEYRDDYPHLISNWKKLCKKMEMKPTKILLVSQIPAPKDSNCNKLILRYGDILTRLGYIVRRSSEFTICKTTDKVIPTEDLYNYMINIPQIRNLLPNKWSDEWFEIL